VVGGPFQVDLAAVRGLRGRSALAGRSCFRNSHWPRPGRCPIHRSEMRTNHLLNKALRPRVFECVVFIWRLMFGFLSVDGLPEYVGAILFCSDRQG